MEESMREKGLKAIEARIRHLIFTKYLIIVKGDATLEEVNELITKSIDRYEERYSKKSADAMVMEGAVIIMEDILQRAHQDIEKGECDA